MLCFGPCESVCEGKSCNDAARLAELAGKDFVLDETLPIDAFDERLAKRVTKHLKLAPLKASPLKLTSAPGRDVDYTCAVVGPKIAGHVWPLMTMGEQDLTCHPKLGGMLYEARHARFQFVRLTYFDPRGGCALQRDTYHAIPATRLATMKAFAAVPRLAPDKRVAAYRAVVMAEPGYVPARIALFGELYARRGPWAEAKALMAIPWPAEIWGGIDLTYGEGISLPEEDHPWYGPDFDAWYNASAPPSR